MTERSRGTAGIADWLTYQEAAMIFICSKKNLQNLASKHRLRRVSRFYGKGRQRKLITRLPPETVRALATLTGNSHLIAR